jgi:hypothetical protein
VDHRKSLVIVEVDRRLIYRTTEWWLTFGGRPKDDLSCVHGVTLNVHCNTCAKRAT